MGDLNQALAALKDIHLPAAAPWWDLAWGWWMLLLLMLLLLFFVCKYAYKIKKSWQKKQTKKVLLAEVRHSFVVLQQDMAQGQDKQRVLRSISSLLRRVCLTVLPQHDTAGCIGDAWLHFLDAQWLAYQPKRQFSDPILAFLLTHAAYKAHFSEKEQQNIQLLLDISQTWAELVIQRAKTCDIQVQGVNTHV
ncbi:MAG: DUF4381 domain-containing protein [Mariprofundaceae bacterium]|nr:DUF4381 domain-containing protein [Mariprofundaceae bacterium]